MSASASVFVGQMLKAAAKLYEDGTGPEYERLLTRNQMRRRAKELADRYAFAWHHWPSADQVSMDAGQHVLYGIACLYAANATTDDTLAGEFVNKAQTAFTDAYACETSLADVLSRQERTLERASRRP
jgi:hypothetical protein